MAPIQHLGNIDKRKRASQQVAFGFFSFLSYLVVVILFVILMKRNTIKIFGCMMPQAIVGIP